MSADDKNHSEVSSGNTRRGSKRVSRIPSLLLALFEPNSAKQSQSSLSVKSPTASNDHSPKSPAIHYEQETSDELKSDAPPLAVIRTSGTFGIQDDGSTHLLSMEEPGSRPMTAASTSGRPYRARRDSDNGTVKSHPMGLALYVGNPDPFRESIDESREGPEGQDSEESAAYCTPPSSTPTCGPEQLHRSLTPFQTEHPSSPLEYVLTTASPLSLEGAKLERKSVEGARSLQVNPGRSDASQRAQSPSTGGNSGTNSRFGQSEQEEVVMKDDWTQTSPVPSITSSRSKRPLPRPPAGADNASSYSRGPRARPTSLPPLMYPQPTPAPVPSSPSDLPLLIASHLLSNHATALMRHSAGLSEGAEMMKRMADESMQWGAVLLNMASGRQPGSGIPMLMPSRPWSTDVQPDTGLGPPDRGKRNDYEYMPSFSTAGKSFETPLPPRPIPDPPVTLSREPSAQKQHADDRYTPIPPRMSARRTRSNINLYTEFYDEVEYHGRKGWDELHQAEDIWVRGLKNLKKFLDDGPDEGRDGNSSPRAERKQAPARRSRQSDLDVSQRQSRRSGTTTSIVQTDGSFLPLPADLLSSPEVDSGDHTGSTDDSFLNLMTPPNPPPDSDNDHTVRPRNLQRGKQPFNRDSGVSIRDVVIPQPQLGTVSTYSRGYESDAFLPHPAAYPILRSPPPDLRPRSRETKSVPIHQEFSSIRSRGQIGIPSDNLRQKLRVNTFDLNTQPPSLPHIQPELRSSAGSVSGTGGRKLRKRVSALQLATPGGQTTSEGGDFRQPSTAGSTVKSKASSKKRHWWSRRKEGTDRSATNDLAQGDWRGSLTAT